MTTLSWSFGGKTTSVIGPRTSSHSSKWFEDPLLGQEALYERSGASAFGAVVPDFAGAGVLGSKIGYRATGTRLRTTRISFSFPALSEIDSPKIEYLNSPEVDSLLDIFVDHLD